MCDAGIGCYAMRGTEMAILLCDARTETGYAAMRCAVLRSAMLLPGPRAAEGQGSPLLAIGPLSASPPSAYAICLRRGAAPPAIFLCACYAMPGTDIADAATSGQLTCPEVRPLPSGYSLPCYVLRGYRTPRYHATCLLCGVLYWEDVCTEIRDSYGVSGTEVWYEHGVSGTELGYSYGVSGTEKGYGGTRIVRWSCCARGQTSGSPRLVRAL
eukprot:3317668-Rhodomonas_salina.1